MGSCGGTERVYRSNLSDHMVIRPSRHWRGPLAETIDRNDPQQQPELKRVLGPWLLLLFIVGDILGTGIYALTGRVAGEVGGAVWVPFLVAFAVAMITGFSYLELVTKRRY